MPVDEPSRAEVNARLAAIIESSDDAIVSKTLEGVIKTWNKGAERIFGWSALQVMGRIEEEEGVVEIARGSRAVREEVVVLDRRADGTADCGAQLVG